MYPREYRANVDARFPLSLRERVGVRENRQRSHDSLDLRLQEAGAKDCQVFGGSPSPRPSPGGRGRQARRGLAPLEMVLSLPILLFVMALMINFDTLASWKVRALSVARNAVWSTRYPRNGAAMPRPDYWPQTASVGTGNLEAIAALDDPRVDLPVARGPLPGVTVQQVLDPTPVFRQGTADIERAYPLLAKLGPYNQHAETEFLGNTWQYGEMGLGSNLQQRIPVIYVLPQADPSLVQAYETAAEALINANQAANLASLGFPVQQFCSLDQKVAQDAVNNLIKKIQGQ